MSDTITPDHGPVEEKYKEKINLLAAAVDDFLNGENCNPEEKECGFVICMFDLQDGPAPKDGRFNYISNCERTDVIAVLKEVIARHEGRYHLSGVKN